MAKCLDCKYFDIYDWTYSRDVQAPKCYPPIVEKKNHIAGGHYTSDCRSLNHDGQCKWFEQKRGFFRKLVDLLFGTNE